MPSKFKGDWLYVKARLLGNNANSFLKGKSTLTITDSGDDPSTFKFKNAPGGDLDLVLESKTTDTNVLVKKMDAQQKKTHRGRLLILADGTPALMNGMVGKGSYTAAGEDAQDDDCCSMAGDDNIEVFFAVKTG